jgi:hypothetical protein
MFTNRRRTEFYRATSGLSPPPSSESSCATGTTRREIVSVMSLKMI